MTRPASVTVVAVLIIAAAVSNLILGFALFFSSFGDNPTLTDIAGQTHTIPTFYLIINAILSVIMGLIYFWLARITLVGSATALGLITILAIINIVFGLFRLPYGWIPLALNLLVLILVSSKSARSWFTQTA
jgi:hypothetical protein